jgi:DNA repair protein RecO (recombination protein O)
MATYKLKGFIIKRRNFGEADRLLTLFTDKKGKVRAVARGSRKILSRIAGHVEPFCLTDFVLAEGRNLDIVTQAQTIKCYLEIRKDLSKSSVAYYIAELVDELTQENDQHKDIFDLIEEVLESLNHNNDELLLRYFEINLVDRLGFRPETQRCVNCDKKLILEDNYFSPKMGGILCPKCRVSDLMSLKISPQAIKILRLFLSRDISVVSKLKINKKLQKELNKIIDIYLKYIAQKEMKSKKFVQLVNNVVG